MCYFVRVSSIIWFVCLYIALYKVVFEVFASSEANLILLLLTRKSQLSFNIFFEAFLIQVILVIENILSCFTHSLLFGLSRSDLLRFLALSTELATELSTVFCQIA